MSSRETPKIDESLMQDIVSRGGEPPTQPEQRQRPPRDRSKEYLNRYLPKVEFSARQLIYVSKETHAALTTIVQIVGGDKSNLSSYVENIICSHFEANKEIINNLYANKFKPPVQ